MKEISILIPFRSTGDRTEQFNWLQKKWKEEYPEAEIIVEEDDGQNPFSKTIAVNKAYKKSTSDIIAIVDADVWVNPEILTKAANEIRNKKVAWVQPCKTVYRIDKETTYNIIKQKTNYNIETVKEENTERVTGVVGLVAVCSREQYEYIGGMDERFRGWGWEDTVFNITLNTLFGKSSEWDNIVYHLWHPRARDENGNAIWEGQTQRNAYVGKEYSKAKNNKNLIEKIVKENRKRNNIGE